MLTAIVLISATTNRIPEVAAALADLDGVSEVYSVTGDIDRIAMVRVREHDQLATVIADHINKVDGVLNTDTHRVNVLPGSGRPHHRSSSSGRRYVRISWFRR